jgi:hypothetical protein
MAIKKLETTLEVLSQMLEPGGRLCIRGYNFQSRRLFFTVGRLLGSEFLKKNFSLFGEFAFSPAALRRVLTGLGFTNIRVYNSAVASDVYGPRYVKPVLSLAGIFFTLLSFFTGRRILLSPGMLVIADKPK